MLLYVCIRLEVRQQPRGFFSPPTVWVLGVELRFGGKCYFVNPLRFSFWDRILPNLRLTNPARAAGQ